MSAHCSQKGFTFIEVMVAVTIMAVGFLAMAQMQYLSLRQSQEAEDGTFATNVIQFIADRDMEEVKRAHLLNSITFMDAQAGRTVNLGYCNGSSTNGVCKTCPCDPLAQVTPDPTQNTQTTCALINLNNFDPKNVSFQSTATGCKGGKDNNLVIVKLVNSQINNNSTPPVTSLNVTYAVKSINQFAKTGFQNLDKRDTLAIQDLVFSAHKEDWSQYVANWTNVDVPDVE